ncbi:HYDROLASE FAMILY PROTEIN / HAD-SUPERFAMILY PROTEIN [Salix koriyanagi]|uniref:HYDROLASE FAMILY PROTEIN / HAD-SUPERFAMILY PROTEIN n=1 Tax=Salix koriyanagi TaxID=2511006 RepID=A0A9Q0WIS5_9ROSI|nr:HYDROLASE FAMILY PROTEIN / HAD-SUPERFAMILY PROTEIN [Salix koriyanagi]
MRFQRSLALVLPRMRNKFHSQASRYFSSLLESEQRSSFGIAFDIDGVILRGRDPIGGSPQAVRRLYKDSGNLNVPFLFLTNGGGVPESKRANELTVSFSWYRFYRGHSPFKSLLKRYENQLIIAAGKGEPAVVMSEYGFKKVVSIDEYASLFENIDPLSEYKKWTTNQVLDRSVHPMNTAAFPSNRLGMGAFRIALESVFNRVHHNPLEHVSFGKPNPVVFKNAEAMLMQLQVSYRSNNSKESGDSGLQSFKTLYMIGDNPSVDIKGARQVCTDYSLVFIGGARKISVP